MRHVLWYAAFAAPVFLQASLAWKDSFLFPSQLANRGITHGLPFAFHGGMWSDVFPFAIAMAWTATTIKEWNTLQVACVLVVGMVTSCIMHFKLYVPGGEILPEAHTYGGKLSACGYVHLMYMAVAIGFIVLFYIEHKRSSIEVACMSSFLLVHVVASTHIPFKAWVKFAKPTWYPAGPVVDWPTAGTLVGVLVGLVILSLFAARR